MKKQISAKKIIAILLVSAFLCASFYGCAQTEPQRKETKTYNVTVQGSVFGGADDDRISLTVAFDPTWITEDDNGTYNGDLAAFAAVLSDDVYFRKKDLDRGTQNRVIYEGENEEEYDWTAFLKEVGFSEVEYIESYKAREYSGDSNDSATLLLAHTVSDEKYDIFVFVLRGCFSAQEWISVYDPGSPDENYVAITGEHSEWTDEKAYKGLDIAKNRAMKFIDDFIEKYGNPELEDCVLVTGHSRGGGLANMIGAEMEGRKSIRSCAYTFNAPGVTLNANAGEYRTVFNIYDKNDYYIDPMPFANEKFLRYGKDVSAAVDGSSEIRAEIARLKGRDDFIGMTAETKAEFAEMFGRRFPDRSSLYVIKTVTEAFDSEQEAIARAEECISLIGSQGLGLEPLCRILGSDGNPLSADGAEPAQAVTLTDDGKYKVSLSYCDGALLTSFAKSLAYGEAAYQGVLQLFRQENDACAVLDILMSNAAGIGGGHLLINSFVISRYGNVK